MLYLSLYNGLQAPASMSFLYISFSCRMILNIHIAVSPSSHFLSFQPALAFVMLSMELSLPMQRILPYLFSRVLLKISPTVSAIVCMEQSSSFLLAIVHAHYICNMKYHGISVKLADLTKAILQIKSFMSYQPLEFINFVAK